MSDSCDSTIIQQLSVASVDSIRIVVGELLGVLLRWCLATRTVPLRNVLHGNVLAVTVIATIVPMIDPVTVGMA